MINYVDAAVAPLRNTGDIRLYNAADFDGMRKACQLTASCLDELVDFVKPGVKDNPMGPFKIILSHGYGFRIHGNNNPGSIGHSVTSGCIRMRNDEGREMAKRIDVGTEVVFLQ